MQHKNQCCLLNTYNFYSFTAYLYVFKLFSHVIPLRPRPFRKAVHRTQQSQLLAEQMQTLLYFWRREIQPAAIEALEEEYQSMIRLKLALRETKPVK